MEIGYQIKRNGVLEEYKIILDSFGIPVLFYVWLYLCMNEQVHINMNVREYGFLGIICAIIGSIVVICFCKTFEDVKIISPLIFVGKHSMELYCIHCLDRCFLDLDYSQLHNVIIRLMIDVGIMLFVVSVSHRLKLEYTNKR